MDATTADAPEGDDTPGDPDEGRTWWATQVHSALHSLGGIGASALQLIYEQQLTQAQVALRLGVAESTVKTQVARALAQLAAMLAADPSSA